MDALSDICAPLRLVGGVYFRCELAVPWGMDIAAQREGVFHLLEAGECWLRMPGRAAPILLRPGDLVVLPHGHRHTLVDTPDGEAVAEEHIVSAAARHDYGPVVYGTGAKRIEFVCGWFRFDRRTTHPGNIHPILGALPPLIHLHASDFAGSTSLKPILTLIAQEVRAQRSGVEGVVNRLVEALFIQVVRCHLEGCGAPAGVLAAVADKQVSKALGLIHSQPGRPWRLDSLAAQAGCSRSVMAARFRRLVGRSPMEYLHAVRMDQARELLAGGGASTALVAGQAGYASESSFAKAFKKATGLGPGAFRRRLGAPSGAPD